VRLWPDSARALFGSVDALPLLTPNWDKRYLALDPASGAFDGPLPLHRVYLLGARGAGGAEIRPLGPREGLLRLVACTSAAFHDDPALRAREFEVLSRIAAEVPLRHVSPPDDPARLPALCLALEEDAAGS
jgi:hypothetical protein